MITSVFHVVISTIQLHHKLLNNWATYKEKKNKTRLVISIRDSVKTGAPNDCFL